MEPIRAVRDGGRSGRNAKLKALKHAAKIVAPEVFREGLHALPSPSGFVRELVMRTSPSIAPYDGHEDVYIVLDDFGSLGRAWRETDEAGASRTSLIRNLLDGQQYEKPVCVVAFNTSEG
jgi:hypothetical protein